MTQLNEKAVCGILNEIIEYEMAGVVRYAHSSLMISGPYRLPIVTFLQEQANESLAHALQAGELITGFGGHPSQRIADIEENHDHSIQQILKESFEHETHAISLYKKLLTEAENSSIMLEEYARSQIGQEEQHAMEIRKMLRDFTVWAYQDVIPGGKS